MCSLASGLTVQEVRVLPIQVATVSDRTGISPHQLTQQAETLPEWKVNTNKKLTHYLIFNTIRRLRLQFCKRTFRLMILVRHCTA
jgi:hypothetical protein